MTRYDDTVKFAKWLSAELKARGIRRSELADKAGVSRSTITRLMQGEIYPSDFTYTQIAKAMGEPPDKILRLANRLPAIPETNAIEQDFLNELRLLDQQQRQFIIDAMHGLQKKLLKSSQDKNEHHFLSRELVEKLNPPDKEILGDIWEKLDALERHAVYDYAVWRLEEQEKRRNSSDEVKKSKEARQQEIERAIEHLDLLVTIDETDPLHVQRIIDRLQRRLTPESENSATRKNRADQS